GVMEHLGDPPDVLFPGRPLDAAELPQAVHRPEPVAQVRVRSRSPAPLHHLAHGFPPAPSSRVPACGPLRCLHVCHTIPLSRTARAPSPRNAWTWRIIR